MRDYKQVVKERYELDDFSGKGIENNIYACINDVGNYGFHKEIDTLRHFIKVVFRETHKLLDEIRILDCGCGNGQVTRLTSELLGNSYNVYGFEYSKNRLDYCINMNPNITYKWGDIVAGIPYEGMCFHGIMAFDVLSHLRKKEDVISALRNIFDSLYGGGCLCGMT